MLGQSYTHLDLFMLDIFPYYSIFSFIIKFFIYIYIYVYIYLSHYLYIYTYTSFSEPYIGRDLAPVTEDVEPHPHPEELLYVRRLHDT